MLLSKLYFIINHLTHAHTHSFTHTHTQTLQTIEIKCLAHSMPREAKPKKRKEQKKEGYAKEKLTLYFYASKHIHNEINIFETLYSVINEFSLQ